MRRGRIIAVAVVGLAAAALGLMQLKPVARINPPITGDIEAPPRIEATLRRSCYDCHSNETHWRWYSAIAPVSWIVANHVELGRKEINFSGWNSYYPATRRRKLEWMGRALHEEIMPPLSYRIIHPDSQLSDQDRAALEQWINGELARSEDAARH